MNAEYQKILSANEGDLRDLYTTAAQRAGTTVQNIEKDFWVCWTLDALFHHLQADGPRLLFKGGTSLSKAYGLISRFSEDIDVTVFRSDLGKETTVDELESLSGRKRRDRLDQIRSACQAYINDKLRVELAALAKQAMEAAGKNPALLRIELDEEDADRQSLLIHYPSAVEKSEYVKSSVKIESGAKSAIDPNEKKTVTPYLAPEFSNGNKLEVRDVTTIYPQRTFLDKILILHGMTFYFEATGTLRGNGQMSRHYYDVHRLMTTAIGLDACNDEALINDCVRHAKMFFYRGNTGLDQAKRGSFRLRPPDKMLDPLRKDYDSMATMIFEEIPTFDMILESIVHAETSLNT